MNSPTPFWRMNPIVPNGNFIYSLISYTTYLKFSCRTKGNLQWSDKISNFHNESTFHLNKDFTIKACHNNMKKKRGERQKCTELEIGKNVISLPHRGNGTTMEFAVQEIKTVQSGTCVGMFLSAFLSNQKKIEVLHFNSSSNYYHSSSWFHEFHPIRSFELQNHPKER